MEDTEENQPITRVQFFHRKPASIFFSIERVFESVRKTLPSSISAEICTSPFVSRGILRRIFNVLNALFHQRDINHIVGDEHYLALGLKKQKTVLTIHDCVRLHFTHGIHRAFLLWFWYLLPVKRVAAITVVSAFTAGEVIKYTGCNPGIVHVIHCPLPDGFVAVPKEFCREKPVILQVGTGAHNKNLCRVAEALRGIPCRLDIIGCLNHEQRQAMEFNQIEYTAQSSLSDEQMIEKYRQCDLVVFASTYEGFGMPIIEANATGRAVVTSNLGSMPEVAGPAASLVDPYNCASIRAGLLRVIEDCVYRDELIVRGYENAKRFPPQVIAGKYAALYREIHARVKSHASANGGQWPTDIREGQIRRNWSKWFRA